MTDQHNNPDKFFVVAQFESVYKDTPFLKTKVYTDFPERLKPGKTVLIDFFGQMKPLVIDEANMKNTGCLLKLRNFSTASEVKVLVGKYLYIDASEAEVLPEDQFYVHDLIGSEIEMADGSILGRITDVLLLPANDVYTVVTPEGAEVLVPATKEIISGFYKDQKKLVLKIGRAFFGDEN
ncbi:MAG: ribosome maturation factor RimM [Ignavibacteria bacterium]|nr:ribosome maturation factor RimM [Ignavibacteria bacterium]